MGGRVTALRFQKRAPERVNVYLDGQFAFGLDGIDAARLRVGQYLSDADIEGLKGADARQKAYDRAVRFLGYRPRSAEEVRRNLARAAVPEDVIEAVVDRLGQEGYLNDAEFARFWVENRNRFRPKGAQALRSELYQKGLDRVTIDEAVAGLDPAGGAYEAAQPRAVRLAELARSDPAAFRQKLGSFLLRRGFDYAAVREVVARLLREMSAGEEDDPERDEPSSRS